MVLTELIYDSNSTSNSGVINLVKGTFTFVAGQVAHTGGMQVATPVATMGIRGTTVGAYLDADVNGNVYQFTATLLSDPGGGNGLYDVRDPVTGAVLYTVRSTTTQVTFSSTPSNQIMVQEVSKSAAIVQHELATAQILFPIFLSNPANMQGGQQTPQPRNDSLTPPQFLPHPPATEDSTFVLQVIVTKTTTSTDNVTAINNPRFLTDLVSQNAVTPAAAIAIAPVEGNNIINLAKAQSGFAIIGSEEGADGQIIAVTIFDGGGRLVGSYTTTAAASGSWSVTVPPAYAAALADGIYTIKATVSDLTGNPPAVAMQTIMVDQTPPVLTVAAINGDNLVNRATAQAGFAISGTEVGADGQPVTVFILDSSGKIVAAYTTLAGAGSWSVNVSAAYATALADGAYTVRAVVSDAAGNPSSPATQVIAVHESGPSVALAAIAGDNVMNRSEAQAGFVISGSETGADARTVTITILDSNGHAVDSYTTTAASGVWSVPVTPAEAIALADGSYRVTAAISDTFGNQAIATQTLTVDQTPPPVTISAITGDNVVNQSEAQTGFVIAGTETGAEGQIVTVQIVDSANRVVQSYTTTAAGGAWAVERPRRGCNGACRRHLHGDCKRVRRGWESSDHNARAHRRRNGADDHRRADHRR
jgi:hypothetical protein